MIPKTTTTQGTFLLALLAVPVAAHAHVLAPGSGFGAGFAHPFLGLDHLLAMIAVGLWAAQLGGRALWAIPLAFVTTFTAAAFTGSADVPVAPIEAAAAASVFTLGLLIATAARLPLAAGVVLVSAFAVFHGHLHGVEMLQAGQPWFYGLGFVCATVTLHLAGLTLARVGAPLLRASGIAIVGLGVALWLT